MKKSIYTVVRDDNGNAVAVFGKMCDMIKVISQSRQIFVSAFDSLNESDLLHLTLLVTKDDHVYVIPNDKKESRIKKVLKRLTHFQNI